MIATLVIQAVGSHAAAWLRRYDESPSNLLGWMPSNGAVRLAWV